MEEKERVVACRPRLSINTGTRPDGIRCSLLNVDWSACRLGLGEYSFCISP